MATHKSAEKRMRQARRRQARNQHLKSRTRSIVKGFRQAADAGDSESASQRLRDAESAIRKTASKGIIPKRRASRSVSRLAKRLNALSK